MEHHFVSVFSSEGTRNWGSLLDCIIFAVSNEIKMALVAPISDDKLKEAALKMGCLKAPGPDGFQLIFYQTYWEVVREDVSALVRALLQDSISPGNLNDAHIVMIPTVLNLDFVMQFRPISLCNYSYKIMSKVLAN